MFDITHNSHTYVFQIEHDIELEYLYGNDLLDVYIYYKIIIIISFDNQELLTTTREIFWDFKKVCSELGFLIETPLQRLMLFI